MSNFKIHISFLDDRIRVSERGIITGQLFISVGQKFFPNDNWDDFILSVLSMWITSAVNLLNKTNQEEFLFMDGSFSFILDKVDKKFCRIKGIYYGIEEKEVIFEDEVLFHDVLKEIVQAQEALFVHIKNYNWNIQDVDVYINQLDFLKETLENIK
ncbi:hypothetical protein [Zophobihabitans entericus]|uniref:Uncharacterized protein n=1 Tax=Zophobihabitans entericus TaxID=1635327 RepID=A0A6G9IC85_9GAMM|nr:hypothetical protein [Zophobihabitans entericus]QIQ21442.1 hypothetical protein IPMB12_06945 [Zophobihabitans entericus]